MGGGAVPDVIVVGAGPTGLLLAAELARQGVACRVLERRTSRTSESRALGLQARTLDVLDMRGIAEEVVSEGNPIGAVRLSLAGSVLDLAALDTRFGQLHITPQGRTEAILERHAASLGVTVERGLRVLDVAQDEDGAEVRITDGNQVWPQRASWVVGCDGAYSAVRTSLGIHFPGHTYPYTIIVADVRLRREPPAPLTITVGRGGLAVSTDFGNGWFRLGVIDRSKPWSDSPVGLDEVRETIRSLFGEDLGPSDPLWTSRFRISERQATAYRAGRVLLAGDAAHVHSPLGGQGLNLGLQDAMNLGWKLAATVRGEAPPGLLDTYPAERRRVSARVVRATDVATRVMTSPHPLPRALRRAVVPAVLHTRRGNRWAAGGLSGISVRYGGRRRGMAGRRVPDLTVRTPGGARTLYRSLRDGRFVLVDASGGRLAAACAPWGSRVEVLAGRIEGRPDAARYAGILTRPDGYCAWAGDATGADDLAAALRAWCGRPDADPPAGGAGPAGAGSGAGVPRRGRAG